MSITFHCEHCGNKIIAKDESVGKWGICPACHNKVYIPDLNADPSDLKLAPINEEDEARQRRLMSETYRLTEDILKEREKPSNEKGYGSAPVIIDEKKLRARIISYLKKMGEGQLDAAKDLESQITPYRNQAISILDKIALSEIPDTELAHIPRGVLSTIIRNIRNKIIQ